MLVEAIANNREAIPESIRHYSWEQKENGNLPLTIGKKYVVSGIQHSHGNDFYLIIADENELSGRPWWYPKTLFKVLDETRPSDWVDGDGCVSFPELAQDKTGVFDSNLQDGDEEEKKIFLRHYEQYARDHNLWYVDGKPVP